MAFLIRKVSHSAEGREIVRTARIEGDMLAFGRDPASDLHLTDLAVALQHGRIERVGDRLRIVAGEGLSVEVNGRQVSEGTIALADGGAVRIASHVLEIMPAGADTDEVRINVARAGVGEAELEKADVRRFSLAGGRVGKRPLAWALALIVLSVFLIWPIWSFYQERPDDRLAGGFHPDRLWLSGSLSEGHAALKDDCRACHVEPFVSVRDEACSACHTAISDHADHGRLARARPELGRWGRFQLAFQETFGLTPGRCVDCHTEHEGPQEIPPTPQRFCADCHGDMAARLPDTRLGNASDFARAHPEFQPAVLIDWDGERPVMQRVGLDRNPRDANGLKFPHDLHLSRSNAVAQMARRLAGPNGFGAALECADCHVPTPDGVRFQPVNMEQDCGMCHSLAFDQVGGTVRTLRHGAPDQVVADLREFYRSHGPARPAELSEAARRRPGDVSQIRAAVQFARARAGAGAAADRSIRAVFQQGGACYACHTIDAPAANSMAFRVRPVAFPTRYMHHGWFDHRAHVAVQLPGQARVEGSAACLSCHVADRSGQASDLLLPNRESCAACHGGERSDSQVPSTCAMCHDYHMDEGQPAMLLRRQVRGRRWETTVIPVEPRAAPAAGGR